MCVCVCGGGGGGGGGRGGVDVCNGNVHVSGTRVHVSAPALHIMLFYAILHAMLPNVAYYTIDLVILSTFRCI